MRCPGRPRLTNPTAEAAAALRRCEGIAERLLESGLAQARRYLCRRRPGAVKRH